MARIRRKWIAPAVSDNPLVSCLTLQTKLSIELLPLKKTAWISTACTSTLTLYSLSAPSNDSMREQVIIWTTLSAACMISSRYQRLARIGRLSGLISRNHITWLINRRTYSRWWWIHLIQVLESGESLTTPWSIMFSLDDPNYTDFKINSN